MTNEKANNEGNWINKLRELENIPGEVFNKETSWNKLHERLYSESNRRKAVWYWLAAACLFFALFISLFISHKKENVLVNNNLQSNKNNSTLVQHAPVMKKDTSSEVSSLSHKNKLPVLSINEINKTSAGKRPKIIVNEIVKNQKEEETIIPELTNNNIAAKDSAISLVVNVPQKKKLKVVHINELGDPVLETPNIARFNEQHSFQFKFMNQEVYTRPTSALSKTGVKIFTKKNLSTN